MSSLWRRAGKNSIEEEAARNYYPKTFMVKDVLKNPQFCFKITVYSYRPVHCFKSCGNNTSTIYNQTTENSFRLCQIVKMKAHRLAILVKWHIY